MAQQKNLLSNFTSKDLKERVKSTIAQIKYITIATVSKDGKPWNAPTFFAYDENYNFFWGSPKKAQHSQNIKANSQAYIVIYDSTVTPGTGKGVYIEAQCRELTNYDEMKAAFELIMERRGDIPYWEFKEFQHDQPISLFKAKPLHIFTNGGINVKGEYIDSRIEVTL